MTTTIYFDLDGTLFDLYGVDNWLPKLRACDPSPYEDALPMQDFRVLARLLNKLQAAGYNIGVITWLSKESTPEYDEAVRRAKRKALAKRLPSVDSDEIHMVKYGTPKYAVARNPFGILFDDEEKNRERWKGAAFPPEEIFEVLKSL